MQIRFITGNLFDADKGFALAHCISSDFAMEKGIAVEFTNRGVKNYLKTTYPDKTWTGVGYCLKAPISGHPIVYNLVTKQNYWHKPTYSTITNALEDMKRMAVNDSIPRIAMPRIGCGLDRLTWDRVENIIKTVFADTDIEIAVYSLN